MEYLYSDEGQLTWLKGYCHPIRFNAMSKAGKIPQDLLDKLPPAEAYEKAVFPTLEDQNAAKARSPPSGTASSARPSSNETATSEGAAVPPSVRVAASSSHRRGGMGPVGWGSTTAKRCGAVAPAAAFPCPGSAAPFFGFASCS